MTKAETTISKQLRQVFETPWSQHQLNMLFVTAVSWTLRLHFSPVSAHIHRTARVMGKGRGWLSQSKSRYGRQSRSWDAAHALQLKLSASTYSSHASCATGRHTPLNWSFAQMGPAHCLPTGQLPPAASRMLTRSLSAVQVGNCRWKEKKMFSPCVMFSFWSSLWLWIYHFASN